MPPSDLQRRTRWAGLVPGDPVQVIGTRIRGAAWTFMAYVVNTESKEEWVEVVGGRAGDRKIRSFGPDRIFAVTKRSKSRTSPNRAIEGQLSLADAPQLPLG